MTRQFPPRLAQLATALALVFFASSIARHHPDAATAAEAGFMALLAGTVLLALSLSARTAPAVVAGGSLVGLTLFLPAAEGSRGALIAAILVVTTAWCTWRLFVADDRPSLAGAAAVAIAWQALLRSDRLLTFEVAPETAVWLLALPLVAASAAVWLGRNRGGACALFTLAALLLLTPGAGVVAAAVLVVLAAASEGRPSALPSALLIVGACAVAIARLPAAALPLLILVGALALERRAVWRWLPALGAGAWALTQLPTAGGAMGTHATWLVLALPAAFSTTRDRWPLAVAALALGLAQGTGDAATLDPATLAPAVGLLTLAVASGLRRQRWQAGWSLVLLGTLALLACYPWLRRPAVELPSHLAGWPVLALALAAIALASFAVSSTLVSRWSSVPTGGALLSALALAALGAFALLEPPRTLLLEDAVTLNVEQTTWSAPLDGPALHRLTVDTFLTGSAGVEPGRTVATIRLLGDHGERREMPLRQGEDTADWAAHRLDPATAPPPWITWLAADGSRAQRYRTVWSLETPFPARRIQILRDAGLDEAPRLSILQVALR